MKGNPHKHVLVSSATHQKLKVAAVMRGIPLTQLMEQLAESVTKEVAPIN